VRRTVLVSLVAAGSLVLAGCGDDETSPSAAPSAPASAAPSAAATTAAPTPSAAPSPAQNVVGSVTLQGGKPEGDVLRISTKAGEPAVLMVTSDQATELHVHGADRTVQVPANQPTAVDVSQPAGGSYEVEDHDSGALLAQLRVS
jgi:hypothetical protein